MTLVRCSLLLYPSKSTAYREVLFKQVKSLLHVLGVMNFSEHGSGGSPDSCERACDILLLYSLLPLFCKSCHFRRRHGQQTQLLPLILILRHLQTKQNCLLWKYFWRVKFKYLIYIPPPFRLAYCESTLWKGGSMFLCKKNLYMFENIGSQSLTLPVFKMAVIMEPEGLFCCI